MTGYTPTTGQVRNAYGAHMGDCHKLTNTALDEFDRWHAAEIRKAKAQAWGEGITASDINLDWQLHLLDHNPYMEEL